MKRVSYKVAKAIKESGYPQDYSELFYNKDGGIVYPQFMDENDVPEELIVIPYATEVWFWLWREMKIFIEIKIHFDSVKGYYFTAFIIGDNVSKHIETSDHEEAIEQAIEYLIDNDLIK